MADNRKTPKYPFTFLQKIDYRIFARRNKAESENIDTINALTEKYFNLSGVYWGAKVNPMGFTERFKNLFKPNAKIEESRLSEISAISGLIKKHEDRTLFAQQEAARKAIKPKNIITIALEYQKKYPPNEQHIKTLQSVWNTEIIGEVSVRKGTILYSGQSSTSHMAFNQMHGVEKIGQGMWLTESLTDALQYAYRSLGDMPVYGKQVFAFELARDVLVSEFNQHPGKLTVAQTEAHPLSPHTTICARYSEIIEPLIESGKLTRNNEGHVRYSNGKISEMWVKNPDKSLLKPINTFVLPVIKDDFLKIYPNAGSTCKNATEKGLERHFKSHSMEKWLDFAHQINKASGNERLTTMAKEAGINKIGLHMGHVLSSSTDPDVLEMVVRHRVELSKNAQAPSQPQPAIPPQPAPSPVAKLNK